MHPYLNSPDYAFWGRSISSVSSEKIDPVVNTRFKIKQDQKIATAGSCFARRITKYLKDHNYNILMAETLPTYIPSELQEKYGYGIFSARYDNIYTARQLLQLFLRAYNKFIPSEDVWLRPDGKYVDAFRPKIDDGYDTYEEVIEARDTHLSFVRQMFSELDVLIFTLGLNEAWISKKDGALYPIAPGVAGGEFSKEKYTLARFNVIDIVSDFLDFLKLLHEVNTEAKVILTVSPTPILATALSETHVLSANISTKSALRAACADICDREKVLVDYFPAYDLVMSGSFTGSHNYQEDKRTPTEDVIKNVLDLFSKHYLNFEPVKKDNQENKNDFQTIVDAMCDNILNE